MTLVEYLATRNIIAKSEEEARTVLDGFAAFPHNKMYPWDSYTINTVRPEYPPVWFKNPPASD